MWISEPVLHGVVMEIKGTFQITHLELLKKRSGINLTNQQYFIQKISSA